ncbi:MAG: S24 family peptidase [Cyclobacteriaceae bacterium]
MSENGYAVQTFEKFRLVRKSLGYTQEEAADQMNVRQRDISLLEKGGKKFFPFEYIQFLHNEFVDLNWFFNGKPIKENDPYLLEIERRRYENEDEKKKREELRFLESGINYLSMKQIRPGEGNIAMVEFTSLELYPDHYNDPTFISSLPSFYFAGTKAEYRVFQMPNASMAPGISQQSYLLTKKISHSEDMIAGNSYVVLKKGKVYFRRLSHKNYNGQCVFVAENTAYPDVTLTWDDILEAWEINMIGSRYLNNGGNA